LLVFLNVIENQSAYQPRTGAGKGAEPGITADRMAVMSLASGPVSGFVNRHPTVRMLALGFLLLIGMTLIADGSGAHVPKGYIYAAIGFSVLVKLLNQLAGLRQRQVEQDTQ